jgi:hypothetical protein
LSIDPLLSAREAARQHGLALGLVVFGLAVTINLLDMLFADFFGD